MIDFSKIIQDLRQEYSHIVFPKYTEVSYISVLVVISVICLSVLINMTDGLIAFIFNFIMFPNGSV